MRYLTTRLEKLERATQSQALPLTTATAAELAALWSRLEVHYLRIAEQHPDIIKPWQRDPEFGPVEDSIVLAVLCARRNGLIEDELFSFWSN